MSGYRLADCGLKKLVLAAALVGLSLFVNADVWPFEVVGGDDPQPVVDNAHLVDGLTGSAIAWAFSTTEAYNWHPLTWVSRLLDVSCSA